MDLIHRLMLLYSSRCLMRTSVLMSNIILAQQLNNLLIGLGGAFLAMMAIVTAITLKETGLGGAMKTFARRSFLAASSSLVVCALVGVVCMSMISAGNGEGPLGDDAVFHVACSFVFFCIFGLLECLNTLGLLLLEGEEDDAIIKRYHEEFTGQKKPKEPKATESIIGRLRRFLLGHSMFTRSGIFQKGQYASGLALRFFLVLTSLFAIGSVVLYARAQQASIPGRFWWIVGPPIALTLFAASYTLWRRDENKTMEVSPIPPTVSIKSLATCILLILFFQGWFHPLVPGWVTVMINLTLILFTAISTHFTMNGPILYASILLDSRKNKRQ